MKKIIFSLSVVLAFLISPAIAQKVNGYNANIFAISILKYHPGHHWNKENAQIRELQAIKAGDAHYPNTCNCDSPPVMVVNDIPLGIIYKTAGKLRGNTVINKTQIQISK